MAINWDKVFQEAHLTSGPNSYGLQICNAAGGPGGRHIWDEDKDQILKAAAKYKYRILYHTKDYISFIKEKEK